MTNDYFNLRLLPMSIYAVLGGSATLKEICVESDSFQMKFCANLNVL